MLLIQREKFNLARVLNIEQRRKFGNLYDPCPIMVLRFHTNLNFFYHAIKLQGRRYEERPMEYERLPDLLPDEEYRLDVISYSIINETKRDIIRTALLGVLNTKKAEQWRK